MYDPILTQKYADTLICVLRDGRREMKDNETVYYYYYLCYNRIFSYQIFGDHIKPAAWNMLD